MAGDQLKDTEKKSAFNPQSNLSELGILGLPR